MAIQVTFFEKSRGKGQSSIDGVYAMLHASDDGVETTAALRLAAAIASLETALGVSGIPANYFDVLEQDLGLIPVYIDADDDNIVFAGTQVIRTIA
jgi:hypothetical protein